MTAPPVSHAGRETRLLLLVILVAVAVLLVLARFRFPTPERVAATPPAGPIERLAARATFEELALIIADVSTRVDPALTVVDIVSEPPAAPAPRRGAPAAAPPPVQQRRMAALRIDADLALVYLPSGFTVVASDDVRVVASDAERELALVRVVAEPFAGPVSLAPAFGGPGYVAVFEGARGGSAARPEFIGRADSFDSVAWPDPLLSPGGHAQLGAGAWLFTLDGRLLGLTVPDGPGVAVARARTLLDIVERLRTQ